MPDRLTGLANPRSLQVRGDTDRHDFRKALLVTAAIWAGSFLLLLLPVLLSRMTSQHRGLMLPTVVALVFGFFLTSLIYAVAGRTRTWPPSRMISAVTFSVLASAAVLSLVDAWLYEVFARNFSPVLPIELTMIETAATKFMGFTWLFGMVGAIYVMQITGSARRARDQEVAKAALEASRTTQARQAFLLELGDALRPLTSAEAILREVVRRLGEHLDAAQVSYGEMDSGNNLLAVDIDWTAGELGSMAGRRRVFDYGDANIRALTRGETVRFADVGDAGHLDAKSRAVFVALGIRAAVMVPLVKNGRLVAVLSVHSATPRAWTDAEVRLVEDLGERTWATVERARAEADLAASREALYQSEKLTALGSLLAGVSHELNNPLTVVVAQSVMMEEDAAGSMFATRAGKIRSAAERCAKIVQTFLAMARQKPPTRGHVDVNEVVRGALDLTAYGLRSTGIKVDCDLARDLPPLEADPDQLHQVLANLFVNAQQALQDVDRERRLSITTRCGRRPGTVEVEVADNGPGVPEGIRRRVLEPFFTTKPQGAGTGLGLSFSLGVVEAHGGALELLDTREGAAFRITLSASKAPAAEQEEAVSSNNQGDHLRGHALVVDDEADIADTLAEVLRAQGYRVQIASDGADAKRQLAARDFDIVLSDLRMPGVDGPALHSWIAQERPHLLDRLGFVTGDTMGPGAVRFLEATGRPSLEKPFTPQAVRDLVGRMRAIAA